MLILNEFPNSEHRFQINLRDSPHYLGQNIDLTEKEARELWVLLSLRFQPKPQRPKRKGAKK